MQCHIHCSFTRLRIPYDDAKVKIQLYTFTNNKRNESRALENIFRDATLVHYTKNGFYDIEINLNVYVSHPFQLQRN